MNLPAPVLAPLARLDDLAVLVADHRRLGRANASVPTDQLADWLAGWQADRFGRAVAEEDVTRWRRRLHRRQSERRGVGRGSVRA